MKLILPNTEEVKQIQQGNRETINRFYMANYELICKKARFYANACGRFDDWRDFAHDVLLSFDNLDFTCDAYFYTSLKRLFYWSRCGGKHKANQLERKNAVQQELCNLDAPIIHGTAAEREMTIGEMIESDFDIMQEIDPPADIAEPLYNYLVQFCSDRQKPIFDLRYWHDMSYSEIAVELGITKNLALSGYNCALRRLRTHTIEILAFLDTLGYAPAA